MSGVYKVMMHYTFLFSGCLIMFLFVALLSLPNPRWGPFPLRLFLNFISHWWPIHFITAPKCPTDTSSPTYLTINVNH